MDKLSNYDIAKKRADEIDAHIIDVLKSGKSFRVEAGAGSGKTYSLLNVIDWIQENRGREYKAKKQQIACITYTNAAVDVIKNRLKAGSPVCPSTIHSFAWESMSRFQTPMVNIVKERDLFPKNYNGEEINKVNYTLGVKYLEGGCLYLYHDDVILLFSALLENAKFRRLLASKYPIILIDEYQDSFKSIINPFLKYFIETSTGPQFGFFGDSWQTIYSSNGACGLITSDKLEVIGKESNFRSQKCIVDVLNRMRPDLPQISALDATDGTVTVVTTNEFNGQRIIKNYYKDELQGDILDSVIRTTRDTLFNRGWERTETKILMISHKMLSRQQGYENLLGILDRGLKDADDPHLVFFMNRLEPIYAALDANDTRALYEALGTTRQPIKTRGEKNTWKKLRNELQEAREKTIYDVVKCAINSKLIPIPDEINDMYNGYPANEGKEYANSSVGLFYDVAYSEVLAAIEYLKPSALFSTDHGVKGEEYENVLFVVGRGWNDYKFDEILPRGETVSNEKEVAAYQRNRNLFYVCCSRPKKNLALLITVPVKDAFLDYLNYIFGKENIISYTDFIKNE